VQNSQENKDLIQIVVFGYNRLEKIQNRLQELRKICPRSVYVSIDWVSEQQKAEFKEFLEYQQSTWPKASKLSFYIHNSNQGMVSHITKTVTKVLEEFDAVIVVEDDVPVSQMFINYATESLLNPEFSNTYTSVGGFSILKQPLLFRKSNQFRESPYFLCWGWGTRKEVWKHYKSDLQNEKLLETLKSSSTWKSLGKKQQETWMGRFRRAQLNSSHTWDVQFQYLSFKLNKVNLLPVFRVTENDGFGNELSTHTKDKRPWWLGKPTVSNYPLSGSFPLKFIQNVIVWIESYTVVGDRKLNAKLLRVIQRIKT
jgi:hypothetical protein